MPESNVELTLPTVKTTQLDGLVLLKIIKHCQESQPQPVSGQLLGLDVDECLEVTNCFPLLNDDDENDGSYEIEMLKSLSTVNVDANNIGWYQAVSFSDFYASDLVQVQYQFQVDIPNSVCIAFDPLSIQTGTLRIKALRLNHDFMKLYAAGKFTPKDFADHNITSIFDELPISIHNSHLINAYLYEIKQQKLVDSINRLSLNSGTTMEKLVELMCNSGGAFDEYSTELERYKNQVASITKQRTDIQKKYDLAVEENNRRAAIGLVTLPLPDISVLNKLVDPSRLDSVILTTKLNSLSDIVGSVASQTFQKQNVVKALMNQEKTH